MAEYLYPDGYGTARITMAEMQRRHGHLMEPEYARRLFSWFASKKGKFGIGGGWRPNPSNTSQASKQGKSFHQTQSFAGGFSGYAAVDIVAYVGGGKVHRAPTTNEVPWQGSAAARAAGIHANTGTETWHIQAVEMDGFDSWVNAGRKRPVPNYKITTPPVTVTLPPGIPGFPKFSPQNGDFSLWPLATNKPVLRKGMSGQPSDAVRYMQGVARICCHLNIAIDGYYGNQCIGATKAIQSWNGIRQTGIVDAATWKAIDAYAND